MVVFGVNMFPTYEAISPMDPAVAAEDRGFESLWFPGSVECAASHA